MLPSPLRLGLPNGLFPSGFPTKTLCTPLTDATNEKESQRFCGQISCNVIYSAVISNLLPLLALLVTALPEIRCVGCCLY